MTVLSRPKVLFALEDDRRLNDDIHALAEALGWQLVSARSVEGAMRAVADLSSLPSLLLVDMMVPSNDLQLAELDRLNEQRTGITDETFSSMRTEEVPGEKDLMHMRQRLRVIDLQIQQCIDLRGGHRFLQDVSDKLRDCNLAIFSARPMGDDETAWLKDSFSVRAWFKKPIDPEKLSNLLMAIHEEDASGS